MSNSGKLLGEKLPMPIDNHASFQGSSLEVKLCVTAQREKKQPKLVDSQTYNKF